MTTLTLKRTGDFRVHMLGENHCGLGEQGQVLRMRYIVECRCTSDSLDGRGFLVEQFDVDAYFQSLDVTIGSCENMAIVTARGVWRVIRKQNPKAKILRLGVTLAPEPFAASVTFEWDSDKDKGGKA